MSASGDNPSASTNPHRLSMRAPIATLSGMMLAIGSLFLIWERTHVPPEQLTLPTYYANPSVTNTGFQLGIHWPLTLCAVGCALTLLWTPAAKARLPLLFTQTLCGMLCLTIPLGQFVQNKYAMTPGVIVAFLGGALLLFGAFDRWIGTPPSNS